MASERKTFSSISPTDAIPRSDVRHTGTHLTRNAAISSTHPHCQRSPGKVGRSCARGLYEAVRCGLRSINLRFYQKPAANQPTPLTCLGFMITFSAVKNPRCLVTGASGFVGGQLAELLLNEGKAVRVLVRDETKGKRFRDLGAEIAIGDLRDFESLKRAAAGIGGVYHIAAVYRQAGLPEATFHEVNAEGTRRMLDAAIAGGAERFIHCSTGGVLGDIKNPPGNDQTPYAPGDMYQRSKVEAEKIALEYFRSGKIRGAVIRPGMIYGPADTRHLKMFKMIARRRFFYVGRGDAWVHFCDIRDLVHAFKLAMEHEERNGEIYTIAGRRVLKLHEAVALIAREMAVSKPWLHLPVKPMQLLGTVCEAICTPLGINPPIFRRRVDFFTKSRYFDISKAQRELGYEPAQDLESEIRDTVRWYREKAWI